MSAPTPTPRKRKTPRKSKGAGFSSPQVRAQRAALELLRNTVLNNPYIPVAPLVNYQCTEHGDPSRNWAAGNSINKPLTCPSIKCPTLVKTSPQAKFLTLPHEEILYGGAVGGGKTFAMLMAALQFVQVPGYNALILRRTYEQLRKADSPIPLSILWLARTDAKFNSSEHKWTFPSGATLEFGHCNNADDWQKYQGPQYSFIGFDEVTHFTQMQFNMIRSRLRTDHKVKVPERIRATANPGGIGHQWVKDRFIGSPDAPVKHPKRIFVPANLGDNPALNVDSYRERLEDLDPTSRARMLHGDWETRPQGDIFLHEWFVNDELADSVYVDAREVPKRLELLRYYDLAATAATPKEKRQGDPDYTATCLGGLGDPYIYVLDIDAYRESPLKRDARMRRAARIDGFDVPIWIEQDPGQAGKSQILHYQSDVLQGYEVRPWLKGAAGTGSGSKMSYWGLAASKLQAGLIKIVRAPWNKMLEDHLCALTRDDSHDHDDIADALSGMVKVLLTQGGADSSFAMSEQELDAIEGDAGDEGTQDDGSFEGEFGDLLEDLSEAELERARHDFAFY